MFNITVWTANGKCVFKGKSAFIPRVGEGISFNPDEPDYEYVEEVAYDVIRNEAFISIATTDPENFYGDSID